jgi:hypothetical protein
MRVVMRAFGSLLRREWTSVFLKTGFGEVVVVQEPDCWLSQDGASLREEE